MKPKSWLIAAHTRDRPSWDDEPTKLAPEHLIAELRHKAGENDFDDDTPTTEFKRPVPDGTKWG